MLDDHDNVSYVNWCSSDAVQLVSVPSDASLEQEDGPVAGTLN